MGQDETYREWEPRTVTTLDRFGERERSGKELDDVVRDYVKELLDAGWTQKELAPRFGIGQSTMSRRVAEGGFTLHEAAVLCALKDRDPVALFAQHPAYEGKYVGKVRFPKDHLYTKYNTVLRNAEALGLLDVLKEAGSLGILDQAVRDLANLVSAARVAVRKERLASRKPARRKRKAAALRRHSKMD